jgi:hypothetical protein
MKKVKILNQESEDNESKDLLLKEIELMFENWYFYTDIEKMFPIFYTANTERMNLLYTQILDERFKRHPTFTIEKIIDIYKSWQEHEEDSNMCSYKQYKAKKDFKSALNNEIKNAKE